MVYFNAPVYGGIINVLKHSEWCFYVHFLGLHFHTLWKELIARIEPFSDVDTW